MSRPVDNLFAKAEQAIKRRNFEYAIELLLQGLKLDPLNVEQRKRLRQTEIMAVQSRGGNTKGDFRTSFTSLGTQWRIKRLGMAKKWEEQILEIEAFLKNAPQHTRMLFSLANAFKQIKGGTDAAILALQEVVEVDRTQVEAWRQLGTLYAANDPEKAIQCWQKVAQYRPSDKEAGKAIRDLSAATMVKKAEDRKKEGGGDFRDLLDDSDEAKKLQEEQQIIRTDDDARRAIQRLREKLAENPDEKRVLRQIADLHRRLKEYVEAEKIYRQLLAEDPNDLIAQERLGDLKEHIFEDRVAELEEKLKNAPADEGLKAELEKAKAALDEFMFTELARRVAAHPTDASLKARYGTALYKHGRFDEAIEQFQKAMLDPRLATQCHAFLGRCFKAKDLPDLAIAEFEKALRQIPDVNSPLSKEVTYELGETYAKKRAWTQARLTMEKILAVDIRFRDVAQRATEYRSKEE